MNAYYKGQPVFGPRGPAGPDGSPIGTIISFLGLTAPKDYLICDGAEYSAVDYPDLAAFFAGQFGAANHFGGDGETTFAVPDLRNLFLRGYHGGAEEDLSGEIGEKQEATAHSGIYCGTDSKGVSGVRITAMENAAEFNMADRTDTVVLAQKASALAGNNQSVLLEGDHRPYSYTARPVNMAVLYCIKAAESVGGRLNEYDTEDGWHVRKWSDGYVEMDYSYHVSNSMPWYPANWGSYGSLIAPVEYPIKLTVVYSEIPSFLSGNTATVYIIQSCNKNAGDSLQRSSSYELFNPWANTAPTIKDIVFSIHVTGRWK